MAPRAKPRVLALFLADGCLSAGRGGSEVGWVGREWVRFRRVYKWGQMAGQDVRDLLQ